LSEKYVCGIVDDITFLSTFITDASLGIEGTEWTEERPATEPYDMRDSIELLLLIRLGIELPDNASGGVFNSLIVVDGGFLGSELAVALAHRCK
jgi:hypothetical protein